MAKKLTKTKFEFISKAYGTGNPSLIRQKIMWGYLQLLVRTQVTPGNRLLLDEHAHHFELCYQQCTACTVNPCDGSGCTMALKQKNPN